MQSIAAEIGRLQDDGVLAPDPAAVLIAEERREVLSVYPELQFLTWGGVMLIAAGVGVLVTKNFDRIGPVTVAIAIALASIACYAFAVWRRPSAEELDLPGFVLLLGALLASSEAAYLETQFHLFGANWQNHFLVLAVLHGATAYGFRSKTLLLLSLSAVAAWLGFEKRVETLLDPPVEGGLRALACAAITLAWRAVNRRSDFTPVFDHFGANAALFGALLLTGAEKTRWIGFLLSMLFAAATALRGWRRGDEMFVVYAWVYGVIALDIVVAAFIGEEVLVALYIVVSTIAAMAGLFVIHGRMRRMA